VVIHLVTIHLIIILTHQLIIFILLQVEIYIHHLKIPLIKVTHQILMELPKEVILVLLQREVIPEAQQVVLVAPLLKVEVILVPLLLVAILLLLVVELPNKVVEAILVRLEVILEAQPVILVNLEVLLDILVNHTLPPVLQFLTVMFDLSKITRNLTTETCHSFRLLD